MFISVTTEVRVRVTGSSVLAIGELIQASSVGVVGDGHPITWCKRYEDCVLKYFSVALI